MPKRSRNTRDRTAVVDERTGRHGGSGRARAESLRVRGRSARLPSLAVSPPEPAGPAAVRRGTAGSCARPPRRVTCVHLVRHARTTSNRERRTMGWLDEGIEPAWVPAAVAVADVLAHEPVDWLVSSPLARAVQTAAPWGARSRSRQATWSYSWMTPPSTSRRTTCSSRAGRVALLVARGCGGSSSRARCGRWPL